MSHRRLIWAARLLAGVAVLTAVIWFGSAAKQDDKSLQAWITHLGFWGPLVFVTLLVLCTTVGIPDSLFGVSAGALFGFWLGVICVILGVLITAAVTFNLSRRFLRDWITRLLARNERAAAIQATLSDHGLKLLTLLRLTPLSPVLVNYAAGASSIRTRDFYLGTLALIPSLCFEVYLGYMVAHLGDKAIGAEHSSWLHTAALVAGFALCGLAILYVAKLAREAVGESMKS